MTNIRVAYSAFSCTGITQTLNRSRVEETLLPINLTTSVNFNQAFTATFTVVGAAVGTVSIISNTPNISVTSSGNVFTASSRNVSGPVSINNWAFFKHFLRNIVVRTSTTTWPHPTFTINVLVADGVVDTSGTITVSSMSEPGGTINAVDTVVDTFTPGVTKVFSNTFVTGGFNPLQQYTARIRADGVNSGLGQQGAGVPSGGAIIYGTITGWTYSTVFTDPGFGYGQWTKTDTLANLNTAFNNIELTIIQPQLQAFVRCWCVITSDTGLVVRESNIASTAPRYWYLD